MSQPLSRPDTRSRDDRPGAPAEEAAPVPCIRPVAAAANAAAGRPGLFDRVVVRLAGLPVEVMEELRAAPSAAVLDALAAAEAGMAAETEDLVAALYLAVGATEERRRRHCLLQLRRDVHNGRNPARPDVAAGHRSLDDAAGAALDRYVAAAERRAGLLAELPRRHASDLARCRRRFRRAVGDPDFRNGLLLSSRVLFDELERYVATPAADLTAKERQIERGLLRYLSRMVMKTTPFGTFTTLVPGRLVEDGGKIAGEAAEDRPLALLGDPARKYGVVRLNKRILWVLRRELGNDPLVRRHLDVELNPTLHRDGDRWCFLASLDGRETFQRLPRSPIVDLYQAALAEGPLGWGELEERLAADPGVDAGAEGVAACSDRLLEIGFLRLRLGIGPREADWDEPLARRLERAGGEVAAATRELLAALRRGRDRFAAAPVDERRTVLEETTRLLRGSFTELSRRTPLRADVPFYEDSGATAELLLSRRSLAAAEDSLVHFVRLTSRLAWPRHELAGLRRFFDLRFGGGEVPLLRFYEVYYREHYKQHLERQAELMRHHAEGAPEDEDGAEAGAVAAYDAANPLGVEAVTAMQEARERLSAAVRERWRRRPEATSIDLPRAALDDALGDLPPIAAEVYSTSIFVQVLPGEAADGGPALLVSGSMLGFGKYFSRFLTVLPEDLEQSLRRRNAALEGALLAEICADGDFNANLHPPLVPWDLAYPTVEGGADARRLRATELVVEPHPEDPLALRLRRGSGGLPVLPLDLGFQNPRMRPPLFQLLSQLAPPTGFGFPAPESPHEDGGAAASEPRVEMRPRIVFDGHLILARRRWRVPVELLPLRQGRESDAGHFLRTDRWRRRHGLPREVFVSAWPPAGRRFRAGEAEVPRREHLHKPQYVDFANPLLVDLFGRLADEEELAGWTVLLYERLPDARHLVRAAGRRWVSELAVQVDFPHGIRG